MRKTALIAMLLLLVFGAVYADNAPMTYANAKAEAAKLGKPLLVDFFTTW